MTSPAVSGKEWKPLPGDQPVVDNGRSKTIWLQNTDDPDDLGLFKCPDENAPSTEVYSIGMERVAYVLGAALGLPVASGVYLEEFEGQPGVISCEIPNALTWREFEQNGLAHRGISNLAEVPEFIAFDILLANIDRTPRNIMLQSVPPDIAVAKADRFAFQLIDHGFCGLWPVAKFGNHPDEPPSFVQVGDGTTVHEALIRDRMPRSYWQQFAALDETKREVALQAIKEIDDELLAKAVEGVPDVYMTGRERDLTVELLQKRRDNVDALSHALLN
jgi:hypothetical protein